MMQSNVKDTWLSAGHPSEHGAWGLGAQCSADRLPGFGVLAVAFADVYRHPSEILKVSPVHHNKANIIVKHVK